MSLEENRQEALENGVSVGSGPTPKPTHDPLMAKNVAQALLLADWSGVSIGNKALIEKAVELLSNSPSTEEDQPCN